MKVYLCGGINGLTDAQCRNWRELAKSGLKHETIDPMRRDYRGVEDLNVNAIVEKDLEDIQLADVMLVNATYPSWGTAMEIRYAYTLGKPCVAFMENGVTRVSPWIRYHCRNIRESIEEAIDVINSSFH